MTLLFLTTFLKTYLQLFNQLFWCRSLCFRHRALFFVSQEGKYQDLTWLSSIPYWFKENVSWRRIQEMIFKQRGRLCRIGGCRSTVVSCNPALFNVEVRPTTSLTILKLGTTLKHLRANFGATLKKIPANFETIAKFEVRLTRSLSTVSNSRSVAVSLRHRFWSDHYNFPKK